MGLSIGKNYRNLIGLFFFQVAFLSSFGMGRKNNITNPPAETAEHGFHLGAKEISSPLTGPLAKFDREPATAERGFQVYNGSLCSLSTSLRLVAFRNLEETAITKTKLKGVIAANWPNPDSRILIG